MIGVYNYTVVLTYLSVVSGLCGIFISLSGRGHPFIGIIFLLFSGLCDAFDGTVARMKKDRTEEQKAFGVQIDSLSDLISFGVLPACIGYGMLKASLVYTEVPKIPVRQMPDGSRDLLILYPGILFLIAVMYVLAALIRLAYFNVIEEEKKTDSSIRPGYTGLPVTSAALVFPATVLVQFLTPPDLTLVYFAVMLLMAILFVSPFHLPKPKIRHVLIMIAIGLVEFILVLLFKRLK